MSSSFQSCHGTSCWWLVSIVVIHVYPHRIFMLALFIIELSAFLTHRTETMVILDPSQEQVVSMLPTYLHNQFSLSPSPLSSSIPGHVLIGLSIAFLSVSLSFPDPYQLQRDHVRPTVSFCCGWCLGCVGHKSYECQQKYWKMEPWRAWTAKILPGKESGRKRYCTWWASSWTWGECRYTSCLHIYS